MRTKTAQKLYDMSRVLKAWGESEKQISESFRELVTARLFNQKHRLETHPIYSEMVKEFMLRNKEEDDILGDYYENIVINS